MLLYVFIPKGFFPVQDTGVIQAITEAPQSVSYGDMARRQAALAAAILKDPDVVSLSSFIGVDGTNITLNSGRMLINLKPRRRPLADRERRSSAACSRRPPDVTGISLYMQPVQDLTIDDTVSRTQYQFVLEDANPDEFNTWVPKLVDRLQQLPELEDVASDQENQGLSAYRDHRPRHRRRASASRRRPSTMRSTMPSASASSRPSSRSRTSTA